MTYSLEISDQAWEQIDALPPNAASALADVWAFLELTPWAGTSMAEHTAVRNVEFHDGKGLASVRGCARKEGPLSGQLG